MTPPWLKYVPGLQAEHGHWAHYAAWRRWAFEPNSGVDWDYLTDLSELGLVQLYVLSCRAAGDPDPATTAEVSGTSSAGASAPSP